MEGVTVESTTPNEGKGTQGKGGDKGIMIGVLVVVGLLGAFIVWFIWQTAFGLNPEKDEMRAAIVASGWEVQGEPHTGRNTVHYLRATVKFGGCSLPVTAPSDSPSQVTLRLEKVGATFPLKDIKPADLKADAAKYGLQGCFPPGQQ
jgi:hypothetical protein